MQQHEEAEAFKRDFAAIWQRNTNIVIQWGGAGKMHIAEKSFVEVLAQEWYVLAAYFGTFVLLEIRKYGERIAMHRVARHALWAASVVVVLHSIVAAKAMIRRSGVDFVVIDYVLVMTLTGSLMYLLGCMFEEAPELAFARSRRCQ